MDSLTQGQLLGALRTVSSEFLDKLERRVAIRTTPEAPEPGGEEAVEQTIFEKQLVELTERVDSLCANDDTHWCDVQSQITILRERLDALTPTSTPAPEPPACEHPEENLFFLARPRDRLHSVLHWCPCGAYRCGTLWTLPDPGIAVPAQPACEHPEAAQKPHRFFGGSWVIRWTCLNPACRAVQVNGKWCIPELPSENRDDE